jgi:hypothetical protein
MNKFFWILNLSLLGLAVLATAGILRYHPAAAVPEAEAKRGRTAVAGRGGAGRTPAAPDAVRPARAADVESLWTHSLFRPDRTEEEAAGSGDSARLAELELIGVAIVGDSKVAIIVGPDTTAADAAAASRFGRGFAPTPAATVTPTAADKEKQRAKAKRVYRLGQTVGDSGYTLSAINSEDVELTKGADIQTLMINRGSENSKKRLAAASADSTARAVAAQVAAAQPVPTTAVAAPQPQPQPAAAVATAPAGLSDEQRQAAIEAMRNRRDSSGASGSSRSSGRSGRSRGGN